MPRPLRPIADGLIYHVINRGNNRQTIFDTAGDFTAFLKAIADLKVRKAFDLYPLIDPAPACEALSAYAAVRQRLWWSYVDETSEVELEAIRRSTATDLPYGSPDWVDKLSKRTKIDLTIRPRGRLRKKADE